MPVIRPLGGWSLLIDTAPFGFTAAQFSARLLERGKIAATAMSGWGSARSDHFLRFVFSNEPTERLRGIRGRIEAAL
jgi:aspartate/methionine/tyrosine aminotransferase